MKMLNKLEYVKQAEDVVKKLETDKWGNIKLTTNKIRNMLTLTNELYNMAKKVKGEKINEDIQSHIQYIKMKLVYEAGRDASSKDFVNKSGILTYLDSVGDSKEMLIMVCHYMEALVAYHKFEGAK